ncbi:MAG: 30S ribosomal protein S14, partial [Candidatus Nomurabacteria bacterium]|nr:30S ribosomal protein S14 [Candidatus Nomurabacteria bacterium]
MARKSNLARDQKRWKLWKKFAQKRAELKAAGDSDA